MHGTYKYFFTLLTTSAFWHPAPPFSDPGPLLCLTLKPPAPAINPT